MQIKKFPIVKAKGTNYEVGFAIGFQLKTVISEYLVEQRKFLGNLLQQKILESELFLDQAEHYFPKFIEELRGMSEGANVNLKELILANFREISDLGPAQPTRCTILGIPGDNGYILGHNEDWLVDTEKYLYILDATINGVKITGLGYCYELIGGSVAINGYGLIEAVNELLHYEGGGKPTGVPKNFIARAILDCKTLQEAELIIQQIPRAGGFNHVVVYDNQLWNFETSARKFATQKIVNEAYVHTNHYVTPELMGLDRGTEESRSRLNKVKSQISTVKSISEIKNLLSDREEPSICRDNTIGSVIIDVKHKIYVAYGKPSIDNYYEIAL